MIKILIVEDERPIASLLKMSLTRAGYTVTCVYDGPQYLGSWICKFSLPCSVWNFSDS